MRWRVKRKMIVLGIAVAVAAAALFSISADDTRQTNTTERGPERDRSEPRVDPTDNTANTGAERKRKREQDQDQVGEEEEARGPGIVQLSLIGRLGNNLFEYAAARVVADRMGGWALSLQAAAGNKNKYSTLLRPDGMACFPGVRPLGVSQMTSPKMQALKAAPFRNLRVELKDRSPRRIVMQDWFQDYQLISEDRDRLRQIMALDQSCCGSTAPGENDIVIHHRNYRAELSPKQYAQLHFKDLDYEFYSTVLGETASDSEAGKKPADTIWVVGEVDEEDPLVARLRQEHGNVRIAEHTTGQFEAFCFMARAPRLVMAHSTFSWWAAFLGNATEIDFPLSPTRFGVTVPQIKVTGDLRYVYRDDAGRVVGPAANPN